MPAEDVAAPIYTFNLAGYAAGHLPSGGHRRYTFGGLSDRAFAAIELLERGRDLDWNDLFAVPRPDASADELDSVEDGCEAEAGSRLVTAAAQRARNRSVSHAPRTPDTGPQTSADTN